jgi:hypothetical protein
MVVGKNNCCVAAAAAAAAGRRGDAAAKTGVESMRWNVKRRCTAA